MDVDRNPGNLRLDDGTLTGNGKKLREIMESYGGTKYDETMIHFGFDRGK